MLLTHVHTTDTPPQRIISLVPSQTELLAHLGLNQAVIGITKFCVHPEQWFRTKTRIGGTKQLKLDLIRQLQPDLIIANKEENDRAQVLALAEDFPVWVSEVIDLPSALDMIKVVGKLTHRELSATQLQEQISTTFATLPRPKPRSAAYLIWRKPYMVAGGDTFINAMLTIAGFKNVFAGRDRYPTVSQEALEAAQPDCLLLSSEPFPFREKHLTELAQVCPTAVIRLVDGEAFSWYGSRLLTAPTYFRTLRQSIDDQ